MGYTRGTVIQNFNIRIDLERLTEFIAERIEQAIKDAGDFSNVDICVDSNVEMELSGNYETSYKAYFAKATRYDPPEYDIERDRLEGAENDLKNALPEPLRNLIEIKIDEKEDDADYQDQEPDEDLAYELWRERQLEDD